jgi:hypothetical protein
MTGEFMFIDIVKLLILKGRHSKCLYFVAWKGLKKFLVSCAVVIDRFIMLEFAGK